MLTPCIVIDTAAYRRRVRLVPITETGNPAAALQQLVGALLQAAARASQRLAAETDTATATALLESQVVELLHLVLAPLAARPGAVDWAWTLYAEHLQPVFADVLGGGSPAVGAFRELWIGLPWQQARFHCRVPADVPAFGAC